MTTILSVRDKNKVVVVGDGQASFGNCVLKGTTRKVKRLGDGEVIVGFAGSTADAFTLSERLEGKLEMYKGKLLRACVELAKDWRKDKYLRRLEAMLIVVDKEKTLILTGNGDVVEPEDNIAAIGSGGNYALSAARALMRHSNDKNRDMLEIAKTSIGIASEICVFTNNNFISESIDLVDDSKKIKKHK
ncbi:MAG: ATP-dependent protease subunit HslV [Anaplasmataceae bacterium]|nr:ATP-dependent protease subunit HslV [Anaplasmataceae bacterium]